MWMSILEQQLKKKKQKQNNYRLYLSDKWISFAVICICWVSIFNESFTQICEQHTWKLQTDKKKKRKIF